jgi:succinate-semialdehyde dehydrogenase/glutarate-semialdehyde dehydrogenase
VLGPALLAEADYVQFTGSTATGKAIARQAGELLTGCSLELGGKNPMLVLADADVDAAVSGAVRSSFASAGQLCVSTERLFVHESLHDRLLAAFAAKTKELRLGRGLDWTYEVGSLVSSKQLATVAAHVDDALAKGAVAVAGGRARPDLGPYYFEPTILTGVRPGMTVFAEETFGPVVSVYRFASNHEAIERANDTRYGLHASLWSADVERARRMATRLACGTVTINETYVAGWGSLDAPMGGFKQSGLGRRHGAEGILKYTESQNVTVQRGLSLAPPKGVPAEAFAKATTSAVRALRRLPGLG